jgi:hypothetical protein
MCSMSANPKSIVGLRHRLPAFSPSPVILLQSRIAPELIARSPEPGFFPVLANFTIYRDDMNEDHTNIE